MLEQSVGEEVCSSYYGWWRAWWEGGGVGKSQNQFRCQESRGYKYKCQGMIVLYNDEDNEWWQSTHNVLDDDDDNIHRQAIRLFNFVSSLFLGKYNTKRAWNRRMNENSSL